MTPNKNRQCAPCGRRTPKPLRGLCARCCKRYVSSSVVISQLGDKKGVLMNFVNYSMFIIYSTRPISGEGVLERLRLTNTIKRIALNVFDEGVYSIKHFFVCLLPV